MTDTQRRKAEELFQQAADLPAGERAAFLNAACGGDEPLRGDVEGLLSCHEGGTISSLGAAGSGRDGGDLAGAQIGPYKLVQLIGEGGFGSVYMAEQTRPVVRRVALKIIKVGMDTKQVIARFEAERQALAMMEHPNIARVFDAGATDKGRPYFVMELVQGVPITDYCDSNRLPIGERLALFVQVCRAVQHAHQKGIIHRDIKPSNILVALHDGVPTPKVIDFGIARATKQRLTEKTIFTECGQMIGTPHYMSPEQAEMTSPDIDTRTDIYSLGVLLYKLLTGTTPHDPELMSRASYADIQQIICRRDPPAPSARAACLEPDQLAAAARACRAEPNGLRRLLRGDLDWIVMKAMEKDRARRYESAAELAADVERHQRSQPVLAGPPGALYRVAKLVKRHKAAFGFAMAVFLMVAGFGVWMGILYAKAERTRLQAETEAETARQVSRILLNVFEDADPTGLRGGAITVRDMLDRGAEKIRQELNDRPLTQAAMMHTIGKVCLNLGVYDRASALLSGALRIRRAELGEDHPDTLQTRLSLGALTMYYGRLSEAEPMLRSVLDACRRVLGPDHADTFLAVRNLAWTINAAGRPAEAEPLNREALEMSRRILGSEHPETITAINSRSWLLQLLDRDDEAEALSREALETCLRRWGDGHVSTAESLSVLGILYMRQDKLAKAEPLIRQALEIRRRILGSTHLETLESSTSLGELLSRQGRLAEAEEQLRRTLEGLREQQGADHRHTYYGMNHLAEVLIERGKLIEAEVLLREAVDGLDALLGDQHYRRHLCALNLCRALRAQDKTKECEPLLRSTLDGLRATLGPAHKRTLECVEELAALLEDGGRSAEAESAVRTELARLEGVLGGDHEIVLELNALLDGILSRRNASGA